jgi:hypothetical protein
MPLRSTSGTPIPVTPSAVPTPLGAAKVLNVPFRQQEQTNWCWTACCEMVFIYYGVLNVRQCDMATYQFGADCCAAPSSSVCNQGNWPENIYNHYGFYNTRSNGPLSPPSLQLEINNDRPIEPYYAWNGGGAHVAIIRGHYDDGDLEVNDPWYGPGRHTYNDVVTAYGLGSWTMTYTDLAKR